MNRSQPKGNAMHRFEVTLVSDPHVCATMVEAKSHDQAARVGKAKLEDDNPEREFVVAQTRKCS